MSYTPFILNLIDVVAASAKVAPEIMENIALMKQIVSENRDPTDEEVAQLNREIAEKSANFEENIINPEPINGPTRVSDGGGASGSGIGGTN